MQTENDLPWSLPARYLALVFVLLGLVALLYFARPLIGPLLISAFLAYLLNPVVSLLAQRVRLPRPLGVALVYLLFMAALAIIPILLLPSFLAEVNATTDQLMQLQAQLEERLSSSDLAQFNLDRESLQLNLQSMLLAFINPGQVLGVLQLATANLAWVLVILVTTYYFLVDWDRLRAWLFRLVPPPYQGDVWRLYGEVRLVWQAYLRGQLLLMLFIGLATWLGMALIGLPDAMLIGLLAGALDIIPSLGPVVAMLVAGVVAYLAGSTYLPLSNPWFTLLVLGVFTAIQVIENVWLRPRILGQSVRLHPAIVFIAIVGALALAGVLVALVIVPVIRTAGIVGKYLYCRILGMEPWPAVALPEAETLSVNEEVAV